jgi:hypothetical protein
MSKSKFERHSSSIQTGGGAYIGGNLDNRGGNFIGRDGQVNAGLSSDDIAKLFEALNSRIDSRPNTSPAEKTDLKADVQDVAAEVAKGDEANEDGLARHLRNIMRMAPDIWEVVVDTLISPAHGIASVIRKVAEKAKAEAHS